MSSAAAQEQPGHDPEDTLTGRPLEAKGCLLRESYCARTIRVNPEVNANVLNLLPRYMHIPVRPVFPSGTMTYSIVGDHLKGDGILPGDWIVVDRSAPVGDGDIAVVELTAEGRRFVIVRHVYHEGTGLRLVSSNPLYEHILVSAEQEPEITGRAVAICRAIP